MLFAYFGPETVLPMTSTAAMVAGFLLMFGRQTLGLARLAIRKVYRRTGTPSERLVLRSAGKRFRKDGPGAGVPSRMGRVEVGADQVDS
jgi:hypothetical protein